MLLPLAALFAVVNSVTAFDYARRPGSFGTPTTSVARFAATLLPAVNRGRSRFARKPLPNPTRYSEGKDLELRKSAPNRKREAASFDLRKSDFSLLGIASNQQTFLSLYIMGGTIPWMRPELLDPKSFGLTQSRLTKES